MSSRRAAMMISRRAWRLAAQATGSTGALHFRAFSLLPARGAPQRRGHLRRDDVIAPGGDDEQSPRLEVGGAGERVDGGDQRSGLVLAAAQGLVEPAQAGPLGVVVVGVDEAAAAQEDC